MPIILLPGIITAYFVVISCRHTAHHGSLFMRPLSPLVIRFAGTHIKFLVVPLVPLVSLCCWVHFYDFGHGGWSRRTESAVVTMTSLLAACR
jgi:hypothetical protein